MRRLCLTLLGVVAAISITATAWAFWANVGVGASVAGTGNLSAPTGVVANAPIDSSTVAVSWSGSTLGTGQTATGYYITRVRDSDDAAFPACGTTLSAPTTAVTCNDLSVTDGGYHYTVTAVFGSWTAVSGASSSVTVVNDSSLPSITVTSISPNPNGNGYNSSSPVVVNLSASAGSGIASITYTIDSGTPVTVTASTASFSVAGDGTHTVTYSAQDNTANTSETGTVLVRIDTVTPAAPSAPVLAAASDSGSSATDNITKVTTPTLSGTAEDGATVTLYDGATPVGSAVAASGAYTMNSSTLSFGIHTLTTKATDPAGNISAASASTTVTIDTTAPAAPTAPVLAAASDSGSSATDRITNVTTPTFTGTAESGSTVTLFNGATSVGTVVAAGGPYSVTSSALTTGTKTMTVNATDLAGNLGPASTSTSITIDITAPAKPGTPVLAAASDTGRSATDKNTKIVTPTVTGTTTAGYIVTMYDGATQVGSFTAASTTYTITSSTLSSASHVITTKNTDVAGNLGPVSTSITVIVDTVAPAAPSAPTLSGATNDTGASATDRITKLATPALSGTNESLAIVLLYDGVTQVGTQTTTAATYSVTSSVLATGSHTLTTTATDVAGNLGPSSVSTTITIDTTAPAAPSAPALATASDTGISSSDGITKTKTPTFTGTAEAGITVTLFNGATLVGTSVATGGAYTLTSSTLSSGTRAMTVKATDIAGNAAASTITNVTIDFTLPTVTINQAAGQADPTTETTINYTAVFSENVYGFTETGITFGGTALPKTATITGSGTTFTVAISGMTKTGTVIPVVTVSKETDAAGNLNSVSTTTDSTVTYSDVTAPAAASAPVLTVASDTGISSTDGITKTAASTFTGTAEAGATVALFDGATATGSAVTATGGGVYTATTGTLSSGSHTIAAKITDPSGNIGPASTGTSVTIDTTAPTVTINQAAGQADPTTATSINFTAVFSENAYNLTGSGITKSGTALPSAAAVTGSGTTFTVALSGMTKSGTVIAAVAASAATDAAGNLSAVSGTPTDSTVTYTDSTAPVVTIDTFAPGASQTATASGTAGFGFGDNLSVTVVFCTVNSYPCLAGNTKATLTPSVNASTGAWSVTSATLGTVPMLYARATQTDLTVNTGTSTVAGPIAIP